VELIKEMVVRKIMKNLTALILLLALTIPVLGSEDQPVKPDSLGNQDTHTVSRQLENIKELQAALESGRPTLAYFYYSVACSCTAARCAIASAAIDSIPELNSTTNQMNFIAIDAYLAPAAESLFNLMIMPAVVYYDKKGLEINRLEWGTSREAILNLINHPEIIQKPLD
jgi:hypothetical protein